MINKINILIIFFLVITGCEKEPSTILSSKNFSEEYRGDCTGNECAQVTIDYIKINGENEIATKINFTIGSSIIYFLNSSFERNIKATTISEAAEKFLENYKNDKNEFPDLSPYTAEITITNSYSSPKILSIRTEYYTYMGGAHGNNATKFLNFNPTTGGLLTKSTLFNDKKSFSELAERLFRIENNIDLIENINSTGFWFDNDTFYLPESIGFSETAVILIYNQYEITSYADGPIELLIPMEKALPLLKIK